MFYGNRVAVADNTHRKSLRKAILHSGETFSLPPASIIFQIREVSNGIDGDFVDCHTFAVNSRIGDIVKLQSHLLPGKLA